MSEITDLVTFEKLDAMDLFTKEKGVDIVLYKVKEMVESFHGDASTDKGRAEIKSFCYKIARSKTYIDGVGKDLVAALKEKPKLIDAERRRVKNLLDLWSQECRKPLTEYEEKEKARIKDIQETLYEITKYTENHNVSVLSKDDCKKLGENLKAIESFEEFQEFAEQAEKARDQSLLILRGRYAEIIENEEKEAAKKAEDEKIRIEREKQIRVEAERKAELAIEEKNKEVERLKIKAQQDAEKAEKDRIEAIKLAALEKKRHEGEAKKAAIESKEREEKAVIEAKKQAELEAKKAIEKKRAEVKAREKDKQHKTAIHNKILNALLDIGLKEGEAKNIIVMIGKNKIPSLKIVY